MTFQGTAELLNSEAAVKAAAQAGKVKIETTNIVVNYAPVKWPGGGLPNDPDMVEPLGKGPLVEERDTAGGKVTFKLHQCFPGSRYIVTDTSAVPMAPIMGVVGSGATQKLTDLKATAPITIFLNGLKGQGPVEGLCRRDRGISPWYNSAISVVLLTHSIGRRDRTRKRGRYAEPPRE